MHSHQDATNIEADRKELRVKKKSKQTAPDIFVHRDEKSVTKRNLYRYPVHRPCSAFIVHEKIAVALHEEMTKTRENGK